MYPYKSPLAQKIADYYFAHLSELPAAKQFHFASRLHAWAGDVRALKVLADRRDDIVPATTTDSSLAALFSELITTPADSHPTMPAFGVRKPYFDQFAPLFGLELTLLRLRHLAAVYGIDGRTALLTAMPADKLLALEQRLMADPAAYCALSTYAVNMGYLLHRLVLRDELTASPAWIYSLGDRYDTADPEQLRLLVYLYTHSIIAETTFYVRAVPSNLLPDYRRMLERLEALISANPANFTLDTRLEFLVCARICGYDTPLLQSTHDECTRSLSPTGTFIIDTHNRFAGDSSRSTLDASEHRNVLFIMSNSPFTPHAETV
jgi:hypothetical protein